MDVNLTTRIDEMNVEMRTVLEGLPEAVKNNMLQNFRVEGVIPITQLQIADMMESMKSQILAAMQMLIVSSAPQVPAIQHDIVGGRSDGTGGYAQWTWKSRFHPVPESFIFPK